MCILTIRTQYIHTTGAEQALAGNGHVLSSMPFLAAPIKRADRKGRVSSEPPRPGPRHAPPPSMRAASPPPSCTETLPLIQPKLAAIRSLQLPPAAPNLQVLLETYRQVLRHFGVQSIPW